MFFPGMVEVLASMPHPTSVELTQVHQHRQWRKQALCQSRECHQLCMLLSHRMAHKKIPSPARAKVAAFLQPRFIFTGNGVMSPVSGVYYSITNWKDGFGTVGFVNIPSLGCLAILDLGKKLVLRDIDTLDLKGSIDINVDGFVKCISCVRGNLHFVVDAGVMKLIEFSDNIQNGGHVYKEFEVREGGLHWLCALRCKFLAHTSKTRVFIVDTESTVSRHLSNAAKIRPASSLSSLSNSDSDHEGIEHFNALGFLGSVSASQSDFSDEDCMPSVQHYDTRQSEITSIALAPCESIAAVALRGGGLNLINIVELGSDVVLRQITGPLGSIIHEADPVHFLVYSHDDSRLAGISHGNVCIADPHAGQLLMWCGSPWRPSCLEYAPNAPEHFFAATVAVDSHLPRSSISVDQHSQHEPVAVGDNGEINAGVIQVCQHDEPAADLDSSADIVLQVMWEQVVERQILAGWHLPEMASDGQGIADADPSAASDRFRPSVGR